MNNKNWVVISSVIQLSTAPIPRLDASVWRMNFLSSLGL